MSAAGWTAGSRHARARTSRGREVRLPVAAARMVAFGLLAGFGARAWAQMVAPPAWGALTAALVAGLAAAWLLVAVARRGLGPRRRALSTLLAATGLLVVALILAGTPGELAGPRAWDDLAAGIAQGIGAVPSVRTPYEGANAWTRLVIVLGGCLLVGLAALLAFAPRANAKLGFPGAAALVLGALYLVPVMQHEAEHPFAGGAVFALLLAVFLWLERVERRAAPAAALAVAVAVLLAVVLGPRVDAEQPLVDYEQLAQSLSSVSMRYDWDHGYGPLNWPRDGREVLRIRASDRAYWKATNLAVFDGTRWVQGGVAGPALDAGLESVHRTWRQTLNVTVRGLRTRQFVGAGSTLSFIDTPRTPTANGPGAFVTADRPLRRGNAYRQVVYTPRPTARQLRSAAQRLLPRDAQLTSIVLPAVAPSARTLVAEIPPWGHGEPSQEVTDLLAASPYARAYELAQRLRARSSDPYEFTQAVERLLSRGYEYSERPRRSATPPLMEFLFGGRTGYCQQFSGAMALLLRLGGVPARVAAGFSPGVYDQTRKEFVVRDYDAHSWVEVFFAGIGWVTRDPTPSASPARSQLDDVVRTAGGLGDATTADEPSTPAPGGDAAASGDQAPAARGDGSRLPLIAVVLAAALAAAGLLLLAVRRRRRERAHAADPVAGPLAELQRALRRSGIAPSPQTTLETLAARFRETPAEGYMRTLAAARYGYGTDRPTPAQRAGLRRALGAGRGARRRLRAWWALPPRPSGRGLRTLRRASPAQERISR